MHGGFFFTALSRSFAAGYVGGMFFCQSRISFNQRMNSKAGIFRASIYKSVLSNSSEEELILLTVVHSQQEVKEEHAGCAHNLPIM